MNEPSKDIGQAVQADRQAQADVKKTLDDEYAEMLRKEQESIEAKKQGEAALAYENVRKLGFITKQDMDETIKGIFGKFVSEVEAIRQENTKLREWVMKAKAQGLAAGHVEDSSDTGISPDVARYLPTFQPRRR